MRPLFIALVFGMATLACSAAQPTRPLPQYLLFNVHPRSQQEAFDYVRTHYKLASDAPIRAGVGRIFSYLQHPRDQVKDDLETFLRMSEENNVPVVVQLDGEQWWGNRPDLWNWWDTNQPGYAISNRWNVEWTGWSPDDAIKIAWRNWGHQLRVLPPPNLMSPRYRAACHEEMRGLMPIVLNWWKALPISKRDLLVGVKLGWESSIGVNAWYYPKGNELLSRPASEDPKEGLKADQTPARGVAQIGYAAVSTAGIRTKGDITEADLAEVVRRHLDDLCKLAAELGTPRDRLFTHVAGWKEGELLYQAGLNKYSCPGWSFYQHAQNPAGDKGVQEALARSDSPFWGAVEWLYQGPKEVEAWRKALVSCLDMPGCRYLCIYNWDGIRQSNEALEAISLVVNNGEKGDGAN